MTEQELDRIMRRVLIDSLKIDDERAEKGQAPSFKPTSRYKRRMRAMLTDPLSWLHRQEHPRWQQIFCFTPYANGPCGLLSANSILSACTSVTL